MIIGTFIKSQTIYLEGLKLILNNTYFSYNHQIFKQISASPIGNLLSTCLAGITVNHMLDTALKNTKIQPTQITKYIDDLLIIINKDDNNLLFDELNKINKNVKFTMEIEKHNKIGKT